MIGRVRWWLLPHIGYYLDGTPEWRWWMRPARWAWIALGWCEFRGELESPCTVCGSYGHFTHRHREHE